MCPLGESLGGDGLAKGMVASKVIGRRSHKYMSSSDVFWYCHSYQLDRGLSWNSCNNLLSVGYKYYVPTSFNTVAGFCIPRTDNTLNFPPLYDRVPFTQDLSLSRPLHSTARARNQSTHKAPLVNS